MTAPRAAAGLVAAVLAVYAVDLANGFVYDDHEVVLQQAPVRSWRDAVRIFAEPHGLPQSQLPYYRPTTRLTLLVQKAWHGDVAAPYHAGNALLMAAIALAAFALLRAPGFTPSPATAAWVAAAFALHPVASECVHPIASGRESAMPALFMVAALAAWLHGRRGASAIAFALALWSKEQAIVVPVLVAWADALGLAPDPPRRRLGAWVRRLAPFAAILALYALARGAAVPLDDPDAPPAWAALAANPLGPLFSLLHLVQVTLAPTAALHYEPALEVWWSPVRAALATALLAAFAAAAWRAAGAAADAARQRRIVLFWLGWMPVAMAVNANLLPLEVAFAERYVFVSSLGVAALAARGGGALLARAAGSTRTAGRPAPALAGVLVLLVLAGLAVHRSRYYRDELAFGRQWVASAPGHANAHATLGAALARAGRHEEALAAYREAVRLEPRLAAAHYNLAVLLAWQDRSAEAEQSFRTALRLDPADADAHQALGVLLARRGAAAEARAHLRAAARLRPDWEAPRAALARLGESGDAHRGGEPITPVRPPR